MFGFILSVGLFALSKYLGIPGGWCLFIAFITYIIYILGLGFGEWLFTLFVAVLARFWGFPMGNDGCC